MIFQLLLFYYQLPAIWVCYMTFVKYLFLSAIITGSKLAKKFMINIKVLSLLPFLIQISTIAFSQSDTIFYPRNYLSAVSKGTRSLDGMPAKNFWQNSADYNLKIKINPKTRILTGSQDVTYFNNSPDTLKKLVFRIYPDFYKKGANRDVKIDAADENEGVKISKMIVGDETYEIGKSKRIEAEGTIMVVRIKPLPPRSQTKINMEWSYEINAGSHVRTGMIDKTSGFIAYCFPRIAVYDDVDGWDTHEYLGKDESYFENGNFYAEITVPQNFVVWATGNLVNAKEVLSDKVYYTMEQAKNSDAITNIIDSTDISTKNLTAKNKWNTFKFKADSVPDFAFAFSDHYLWQASGIHLTNVMRRDRVLVSAVFNKEHKDFFYVASTARKSIELMSYQFPAYPYPYPHMTVVDGLDQMEYPMMCNDNPVETFKDQVELTTHEIMHTYFPFFMSTNQTKYGWMDEAWATIGEWILSPKIYGDSLIDSYGIPDVNAMSGTDKDVPIIVGTNHITDRTQFINNYAKPAFVLYYLRDMLGDSQFRLLVKSYMDTWNGKHHTPWDFFNFVSTYTKQNFNWLWKRWYYDWGYPDLAISNVVTSSDSIHITVSSKGIRPVPVNLKVEFSDGSIEKLHESFSIWKDRTEITLKTKASKPLNKITLGDTYDVDINKKDNTWKPN